MSPQKKDSIIWSHAFGSLTCSDKLRDSFVVYDRVNQLLFRWSRQTLGGKTERQRQKKGENNVCKYTWMFSPALGEYRHAEEKETRRHVIMLSLWHSYVEEGLRVRKLGGWWWETTVCVCAAFCRTCSWTWAVASQEV